MVIKKRSKKECSSTSSKLTSHRIQKSITKPPIKKTALQFFEPLHESDHDNIDDSIQPEFDDIPTIEDMISNGQFDENNMLTSTPLCPITDNQEHSVCNPLVIPTLSSSLSSIQKSERSAMTSTPITTTQMLSETHTPGDTTVTPPMTFKELGVCEELCLACDTLGWAVPTDIQRESLPFTLKGRDLIGLAETGSGKTGAFTIPIIQRLLDHPTHRGVFALTLAPTRELTVQIAEQFQALGSSISLKVCTIVGGLDMVSQALELSKKPHIIVGTPGRIVDHLENTKGFNLSHLQFFVLDEADRLLSMDFDDALNKILDGIPKERNTYLFSATMTSRVSKLQRASLVQPVKIAINSKYDTAKNLIQHIKIIGHKFKWVYLVGLLTHLKPYTTMVFSNTCLDAKRLAICLRHLGFSSVCLHGRMTQPQRLGALNSFKSGQKRILIATEVGSRGLDIPHVDVVINFDVPLGSKDYIHRVGRTARAGKAGRAITLVTQYDAETYLKIEQALNRKLEIYNDLTDDMWQSLTEKVEEARRLTEQEIKEEPELRKGTSRSNKKKSHSFNRR